MQSGREEGFVIIIVIIVIVVEVEKARDTAEEKTKWPVSLYSSCSHLLQSHWQCWSMAIPHHLRNYYLFRCVGSEWADVRRETLGTVANGRPLYSGGVGWVAVPRRFQSHLDVKSFRSPARQRRSRILNMMDKSCWTYAATSCREIV